MHNVNLGDKAEDTVTGFSGTVIAITKWLTGCNRVLLQPRIDKDGKIPESQQFDVNTIKVITPVKPIKKKPKKKDIGGPRPNVKQFDKIKL